MILKNENQMNVELNY